jgi:ABC-2 type transport system ATP-binding protein
VIEFAGVGHTYRNILGRTVRAVDDFSLTIPAGEILGLAGPNGAGKSTLIALMLGFLRPTEGAVRVGGLPPRQYAERHGVGYLSELVNIPQGWRIEHALARYAMLAGVPASAARARTQAVTEQLGLAEHRGKKVKQLSKGNLQRLGLAQALLRNDRVLVLDEPTHGLDPVWTQRFRDVVHGLRSPERTIFIASHNLDELQRLADRVAIIDRGRLQRVVEMRSVAGAAQTTAAYSITLMHGAEHVPAIFPDAVATGRGEFTLVPLDVESLNRGIAELLSRGALVTSMTPAHSALETQFRQAVGEPS